MTALSPQELVLVGILARSPVPIQGWRLDELLPGDRPKCSEVTKTLVWRIRRKLGRDAIRCVRLAGYTAPPGLASMAAGGSL